MTSGGTRERGAPAIAVLHDRPERLAAVLRRRFGADYDIKEFSSIGAFRTALQTHLLEQGLVLAISDPVVDGIDMTDELADLRRRDPHVLRCILIPAADRTAARRLHTALAAGCADRTLQVPWGHPDAELHPAVSSMVGQWWRKVAPDLATAVQLTVVAAPEHPRMAEMRDLADRNNVATRFLVPDDPEGKALVSAAGAAAGSFVVAAAGKMPLVDPTVPEIGSLVGARVKPPVDECDLVVIGAGPSGLAAAVYGASEGLSTIMLEKRAIGGQAGTSSAIRNYPGFPYGTSGADLASAMVEQAWILGAESVYRAAVALDGVPSRIRVVLDGGSEITARAVILSMGVTYRRLDAPGLARLQGAGVHYGAARAEARGCAGRDVYVVGGGNSAGQAAVHLAQYARSVTILIRGESLAASMSDYLLREIERTPNINIRGHAVIIEAHGEERLEALSIHTHDITTVEDAAAVFIMIGAEPDTGWMGPTIERDGYGYLLTGNDVATASRRPLPYETSVEGVFAVGDLRFGAVKRVATAVGEGAMCIVSVHQHLARLRVAAETPRI